MSEVWKAIPNFVGYYEASSMGRIKSVERIVRSGRGYKTVSSTILKPSLDEWGYEKVSLRKDGKSYSKKVNRLIAQTFIPNPNNYPQVNHIDGIKTNNCVENLEWCTPSQNMMHCHANGLSDWNTNVKVIETNKIYRSIAECARDIGGYEQLIRECLDGKRKTHKGYHFEIIGKRASDKYNRKNTINKKDEYDNEIQIEHAGEVHSFREWSKITGIKQHTLDTRYYRGDRGERLFRPVEKERRRNADGKFE